MAAPARYNDATLPLFGEDSRRVRQLRMQDGEEEEEEEERRRRRGRKKEEEEEERRRGRRRMMMMSMGLSRSVRETKQRLWRENKAQLANINS